MAPLLRKGEIRMADVRLKPATFRRAVALCELQMHPTTLSALRRGDTPKGEVWATAQAAGILAAKRTSELIPLCHPIPVAHVEIRRRFKERTLQIESEVTTTAPTGPEMEALAAAGIAALTVYDMLKPLERGMVIRRLCLTAKSGGKSGDWKRKR